MPSRFARLAVVTRNEQQESWHLGAVAIVTPDGRPVAHTGDPDLETFVRSAAKPWQAMPLLAVGGRDRFALSDADLAVICASHSGTDAHVARVESLLRRGGFTAADLRCGAHEPYDARAAEALRQRGEPPSALHNNCSGKHAGMLLACRAAGWGTGYTEVGHPLQRRILGCAARLCAVEESAIGLGVDGCGVPAFRLSLAAAARGYAALADPGGARLAPAEAGWAEEITRAVAAAPDMLAGPGRFTTRLSEVTGGRVLGKEGAEGFYAVAVREPAALGVAVKVADGSSRCRDGVVLDVLRQLGALAPAELEQLQEFHRVPVRNHAGTVVGEVVPDVELIAAG